MKKINLLILNPAALARMHRSTRRYAYPTLQNYTVAGPA
jgi:hypothetical protein